MLWMSMSLPTVTLTCYKESRWMEIQKLPCSHIWRTLWLSENMHTYAYSTMVLLYVTVPVSWVHGVLQVLQITSKAVTLEQILKGVKDDNLFHISMGVSAKLPWSAVGWNGVGQHRMAARGRNTEAEGQACPSPPEGTTYMTSQKVANAKLCIKYQTGTVT